MGVGAWAHTNTQFSNRTINVTMETNSLGTLSWSPSALVLDGLENGYRVVYVCFCEKDVDQT